MLSLINKMFFITFNNHSWSFNLSRYCCLCILFERSRSYGMSFFELLKKFGTFSVLIIFGSFSIIINLGAISLIVWGRSVPIDAWIISDGLCSIDISNGSIWLDKRISWITAIRVILKCSKGRVRRVRIVFWLFWVVMLF